MEEVVEYVKNNWPRILNDVEPVGEVNLANDVDKGESLTQKEVESIAAVVFSRRYEILDDVTDLVLSGIFLNKM